MKPMLAEDFVEAKLRFPLLAQPKIDGVRGLHITGAMTGRRLKSYKNLYATRVFSHPRYKGFDGEFAAGSWSDPLLCTKTTSALSTLQGEPDLTWHVFDYLTSNTIVLPYQERYDRLVARLTTMERQDELGPLRLIPSFRCENLEQLLTYEAEWLSLGLEGVIIRDPEGLYKQGRSTVKEGGLLRIKRFIEEDAEVLAVVEGQANGNEARTNELGRTERSSHQENMVPNGLVGTLTCRLLKNIFDPVSKALILSAGQIITVSAGSMDHKERRYYLENPDEIVLKTIKFRFFPKGIKNKPRFPTYVAMRADSDKL